MYSFDVREKIFVIGLSFTTGCVITILGTLTNHNYIWLGLLVGVLCMLFLIERVKVSRGEELFWNNFTVSDKFIYSLDMIILLASLLYPIKEGFSIKILVLILPVGLILTWAITSVFGSENIKREILFMSMR